MVARKQGERERERENMKGVLPVTYLNPIP
jgi:hypothetical protein